MNPINWIRHKALLWAASIADRRARLAASVASACLDRGLISRFHRLNHEGIEHKIRADAYRAKAEALK